MSRDTLSIQQLSLNYEETEQSTLSDISFTISEGETMLLLGPSGSGKSSLTFCLNGIYPSELDGYTAGDVKLNEASISNSSPGQWSQRIGVVFQDPESQFCMLTVEDEIAFGLENIQTPPEEIETRIEEVLSLVDMEEYKESTISSLSGGQKQKVALACVLALQPAILILDEPTANLDPKATQDFIDTIHSLHLQHSFGLIVIEHQLEGWASFIERAVILQKDGKMLYDGPLREAITTFGDELKEQGIWIPKVTDLWLSHFGSSLQPLPLTIEEYMQSLEANHLHAPAIISRPNKRKALSNNLLMAKDLHVSKRNQAILRGIDVAIHKGEFIAILGPNGSGKTTLSRALAGIETKYEGDLMLHQRPLSSWKERDLRKEIGYVFQNPEHQFITDSVEEEIGYGMKVRSFSEDYITQRVTEIMSYCQLEGLEKRHPYTLSQGQKRRLSVATMIVDEQGLLFLDEPTFGQDARSTERLMSLLEQRFKEDTTIVMITHDMDLVQKYATRVLVMEEGRIIADQTPAELWKQPNLAKWNLLLPTSVSLEKRLEALQDVYSITSN
ncbi:ABC transporter ATP-binding protein [Pontibacillus salicampi]|uniref:ABC transporter ATP-binding protein n=1 Tax=Pontibacillus salicampi TaxID=1449801 RepID=A0ABV6LRM2_9BACI